MQTLAAVHKKVGKDRRCSRNKKGGIQLALNCIRFPLLGLRGHTFLVFLSPSGSDTFLLLWQLLSFTPIARMQFVFRTLKKCFYFQTLVKEVVIAFPWLWTELGAPPSFECIWGVAVSLLKNSWHLLRVVNESKVRVLLAAHWSDGALL